MGARSTAGHAATQAPATYRAPARVRHAPQPARSLQLALTPHQHHESQLPGDARHPVPPVLQPHVVRLASRAAKRAPVPPRAPCRGTPADSRNPLRRRKSPTRAVPPACGTPAGGPTPLSSLPPVPPGSAARRPPRVPARAPFCAGPASGGDAGLFVPTCGICRCRANPWLPSRPPDDSRSN